MQALKTAIVFTPLLFDVANAGAANMIYGFSIKKAPSMTPGAFLILFAVTRPGCTVQGPAPSEDPWLSPASRRNLGVRPGA